MTLHLEVDWDRCESNAVCCGFAPTIFSIDDEELLQVSTQEVPPDLADAVRQAVQGCPKAALRLEER